MNAAPELILLTTDYDQIEWSHLQAEYIRALGESHSHALRTLRPIVCVMAGRGATRKLLLGLGVAHGYKKSYVSSLISQILVPAGHRQRRSGAGPKTHPLAKRILAFARQEAGRSARKHLASATRLAKKEDEEPARQTTAGNQPTHPSDGQAEIGPNPRFSLI